MPDIKRVNLVLSANRLPVEIMQLILEEYTLPSAVAKFATRFPIIFCSIVSYPRLAKVFERCPKNEVGQEMDQICRMNEEAASALRIFIRFKGISDLLEVSEYVVKANRIDIMEVFREYSRRYGSPILCE